VSLLQKKLGMKPTGFFGPATRKKVDAFQLKQGWAPSGVGPLTWAALDNPSAAKARPKSTDFWPAYHVVDYDAMKQDDVCSIRPPTCSPHWSARIRSSRAAAAGKLSGRNAPYQIR
jgi:hypothetical protein